MKIPTDIWFLLWFRIQSNNLLDVINLLSTNDKQNEKIFHFIASFFPPISEIYVSVKLTYDPHLIDKQNV